MFWEHVFSTCSRNDDFIVLVERTISASFHKLQPFIAISDGINRQLLV